MHGPTLSSRVLSTEVEEFVFQKLSLIEFIDDLANPRSAGGCLINKPMAEFRASASEFVSTVVSVEDSEVLVACCFMGDEVDVCFLSLL